MWKILVIPLLGCLLAFAAAMTEPEVSFSGSAQIGQVKIEAGLYKVKLIGAIAMFTNTRTGKSYSAVTKPEKTPQRSAFTAVLGSEVDGVQHVEAILLAGSDYRLTFAK